MKRVCEPIPAEIKLLPLSKDKNIKFPKLTPKTTPNK